MNLYDEVNAKSSGHGEELLKVLQNFHWLLIFLLIFKILKGDKNAEMCPFLQVFRNYLLAMSLKGIQYQLANISRLLAGLLKPWNIGPLKLDNL
jgi:hypothetical protein